MSELTFQYLEEYVQANSAPTVQDSTLQFVLLGSGHQPENGFTIEAYLALAKPVAPGVTPIAVTPRGTYQFHPRPFPVTCVPRYTPRPLRGQDTLMFFIELFAHRST